MIRFPPARRLINAAALTLGWCGLWGGVTVANVAGGAVIALALIVLNVGLPGDGGVRLRPLATLTGLVLIDLVRSTVGVAKEVLTRRELADEVIIAVPAPAGSHHHRLLLIVLITLTPGTAVVDIATDPDVLYLHLLYRQDAEKSRKHVTRLASLACAALPTTLPDSAEAAA